jgi:phosphopantothenoylcysteine decarboxylase/phosphopantothenate--cysteine ligase
VESVQVESAEEMLSGLLEISHRADLLVMAAAVSDYRSRQRTAGKLPRSGAMDLKLEPTPDILVQLRERVTDLCPVMAFALEFGEGKRERAVGKMNRKGADAIFLNPGDVDDAGMESRTNRGELLFQDGSSIEIDAASKRYVALLLAAAMGRYMKGKIG